MDLVDKEIQSFAEAGLISKWTKDNIESFSPPIIEGLFLDLGHMKALIYFFCIPINSMALSLFIIELLTGKQWKVLKRLRLLRWLEMLVDGKRYLYLRKPNSGYLTKSSPSD